MHHTIAAVYEDRNKARRAMDDLNAEGFSPDDIYLTQTDEQGGQHQVDEGEGGFVSFFKSLFGYGDHNDDAELYSEAVRRGHYVLTVNVPDDDLVDRVTDLLEKNDPIDVHEQAQQWESGGWAAPESMRSRSSTNPDLSTGYADDTDEFGIKRADSTGSDYLGRDAVHESEHIDPEDIQAAQADGGDQSLDMDAPARTPAYSGGRLSDSSADLTTGNLHDDDLRSKALHADNLGSDMQGDRAIPVIEEELHVGKRQVQRGGVRVYQRVVDTPVNESVHLREEHVDVERRPVDRPASSSDLSGLKDESFEVRALAEEAVVEKTARVIEEVVVGKSTTERDQTISDTLRHTEVEVENLSDQAGKRGDLQGQGQFDQTMYRPHWDSTYTSADGRYEDFEPAYRYGSLLNSNDRYKGQSWDDIEPSVRDEWESGNPGTWEKIKAAVRHGWDKAMH